MPRSAVQLRKAYAELAAQMPPEGWPAGEDYRRAMTLEHGGDPDDLACVVCGKVVAHEEARIVIGLTDYDHDVERVNAGLEPENSPMPPLAFCSKHNGDDEVRKFAILGVSHKALPKRAQSAYGKLRQS